MNARALAAVATATLLAVLAGALPASARDPEPRVVGGQQTEISEWPWQVAIADPPAPGEDGYDRQFCGGSLVAPTVVVTAAHCAYDFEASEFQPPEAFSVISGRTTLSSDEGAETPVVDLFYFVETASGPAAQSQTEPAAGPALYDPEESEQWDVVLLELDSAAPAPAAPIQIAGAGERDLWEAGDPAFVTGWGSIATAFGPYPDDLQEAEVEIVADGDCEFAYGGSFFVETMVCAGLYPEGGRDSCQGDSGGPLVVPAAAGGFRLVGDTSFGTGCGLPGFPGVYGRLADDPMRSALEAAVLEIAGVDITGEPPPDTAAPETTITKRPKKRGGKRRARFRFVADEAATFACKLDRRPFKPCDSPFRKRVGRKRHRFKVRATDAAGNVEAKPAVYRWKVRRRR